MSGIRSPADSPRPVKVERFSTPGPSTSKFTGANWNNMPSTSTLRFEDAVVETVVTQITRTTTSFAPLQLPSIPIPEAITLPTHLSKELYPLSHEPTPEEMKWFSMKIGDQRVVISEDGPLESPPTPTGNAPGYYRSLPPSSARSGKMSLVDVLTGTRGKERKRTHQTFEPTQPETQYTPSESLENLASNVYPSPPRKRMRRPEDTRTPIETAGAPLSPLPSPELESPPPTAPLTIPLGPGHELAALYSLPSMLTQFDGLPDQLQQHVLMHMLRRSRMPTIQRVATFASSAIRRDLIGCLPRELAVQILKSVDAKTLATSTRVSKKWRSIIDSERSVWKHRLMEDSLYVGKGVEEEEEVMLENRFKVLDTQQARERKWARQDRIRARRTAGEDDDMEELPTPIIDRAVSLKHVYRRRHQDQDNWFNKRPVHNSFPGHGTNVITCLQFDREKIVCSSDDNAINVYNTSTGQLKKRLEGHAGGVWALEYRGDTLVTGSTDRNVRVWDLELMRHTHTFNGHTSTVRCLQIVEPVLDAKTGKYFPAYPLIVTGSRDATMRVWKLPKKNENPVQKWGVEEDGTRKLLPVMPDENPYHLHALLGHTDAIRALACYGRYCVSGSYDTTVRLWDIVKGKCLHTMVGHEQKVYSIVYDKYRHRCASGSMDNTVKIWDLETGTCLHTLMGHTSLVGLLGLSPNHLISAAADSSLRVWDAEEMTIQHVLRNNGGAITCFRHDEHKVISGSDGMLKLWDIRRGKFVRDLIIGISSVWQVAVNGNLLVAASNRGGTTVFDIFDFGQLDHPSGVDNEELDNVNWEQVHPREHIKEEMRKKGHSYDYELDDTILEKEQEQRENERQYSLDNDEEEEEDLSTLDEDGNEREPKGVTLYIPPRPIIIDTRPAKKKGIRKSTRISATEHSPKASTAKNVLENVVNSGNKKTSTRGAKAWIFQNESPSAGSSKLPARSLSKVLGPEKDKGKGKAKAVNAIASGSGSGNNSSKNKAPPIITTRITRSRSGPSSASPALKTRTSSAPSRKRSFAPVFDEEEDEEVEEELEGHERARAKRVQDWKEFKGNKLLKAKKELDVEDDVVEEEDEDELDELDSDSEEEGEGEGEGEDDDDMLGID